MAGGYRGLPTSTRYGIESAIRLQTRPSSALANASQIAFQMGGGQMGTDLDRSPGGQESQFGGMAGIGGGGLGLPFGGVQLPTAGPQGGPVLGQNPAPITVGDWVSNLSQASAMPPSDAYPSSQYSYQAAQRAIQNAQGMAAAQQAAANFVPPPIPTIGPDTGNFVPSGLIPYSQMNEAQQAAYDASELAYQTERQNRSWGAQTWGEGKDLREMQRARMEDFLNGVSQLDPELARHYSQNADDLQRAYDRTNIQFGDTIASLQRQQGDLLETYGIESPYLQGQIDRENERWGLASQAIQLDLQRLEDTLRYANENLGSTVANRAAVQGSFDWRQGFVDPQYAEAVDAARNMLAEALPASQQISADTQAAVGTTYEDATARTLGLAGQEIDPAAAAALSGRVGEQKGLFDQLFSERGQFDERLLKAQQGVAVGQAGYEQIADKAKYERERALTDAQFAVQQRNDEIQAKEADRQLSLGRVEAQLSELGHRDAIAGLKNRKSLLDLDLAQTQDKLSEVERELRRDTGWMLEDLITEQQRNGLDRQAAEDAAMSEYLNMDKEDYALGVASAHIDKRWSDQTQGFRDTAAIYLDEAVRQGYESADAMIAAYGENVEPAILQMMVEALPTYLEGRRQFGLDQASQLSKFDVEDWQANNPARTFDPSNLVQVTGAVAGTGRLARPAAQGWELARQAALADNVTLRFGDNYRDYATQAAAYRHFHETYDPVKRKGQNLNGQWVPSIAHPERSQHTVGLAIDLADQTSITWMKQNGAKYGWSPISSEPWHWNYTGVG